MILRLSQPRLAGVGAGAELGNNCHTDGQTSAPELLMVTCECAKTLYLVSEVIISGGELVWQGMDDKVTVLK